METSKLVEEIQKLLREADEALIKSRSVGSYTVRCIYRNGEQHECKRPLDHEIPFIQRVLIHERYLSQERRKT